MKDLLKSYYFNFKGWRTSRKIVVLESDDWGGERLASKQISEELIRNKWVSDTNYNRFDTLETAQDYYAIMEILSSVKDVNSNYPKVTANYVLSNPDYNKIEQSNYSEYHYLLFTEAYNRAQSSENVRVAMEQAIDCKMFKPQFHGREHLQTYRWIKNLKHSKILLAGFERNFFAFSRNEAGPLSYLSAFDFESQQEKKDVIERITEGSMLFKNVFGFSPQTIIAPENTSSLDLLSSFQEIGFEGVQGARMQKQSQIATNVKPNFARKLSKMSNYDLVSLVRNVTFEPSAGDAACVSKALREINSAFLFGKPAVICSHRVNYVGGISVKSRTESLSKLKELLIQIVKRWPEVEFLSSDELAKIIK